MTTVVEKRTFVCADTDNNNNKVWEYTLFDDGTVTVKYGRVGKTLQVDGPRTMSRTELDRKIREKLRARGKEGTATYKPPYREIKVIADSSELKSTGPSISNTVVAEAARTQLLESADPTLTKLVERLVLANKHELYQASGGQLNVDLTTGIVSTPIGVITKESVADARVILDKLQPLVATSSFDDTVFKSLLNDYLMMVPQAVGHARGWHRYVLPDMTALQRQVTLLDQLEASADLAASRVAVAAHQATSTSLATTPNLFSAKLKALEDGAVIDRINKLFFDTKLNAHESSSLKPVSYYEVDLDDMRTGWESDGAKLDNQWLLWHGTRVFNLLSILKSGLIVPKSGGSIPIAGRMFGDYLYFSDQSTKSLNYSLGFWHGNVRDHECFMFLADVAMGQYYVPDRPTQLIPHGYDSFFAKGKISGVMNNEMIIRRRSQANLRYLVEFGK